MTAAVGALFYLWWQGSLTKRPEGNAIADWVPPVASKYVFLLMLAAGTLVLAYSTGILQRSAELIDGDASVGNRFLVWKGALQMIADRPLGVGWGNSGYEYMQWYQQVDLDTGYRTLVNSYLTFTVEFGMLWSLLVLSMAAWIWFSTAKRGKSEKASLVSFRSACRASLLAFAVAGFFTTTMEEPWVWIIPLFCVGWLHWKKHEEGIRKQGENIRLSLYFSVVILFLIWTGGIFYNNRDIVQRSFKDNLTVLKPREERHVFSKPIWTIPDEKILGEFYGKRLRDLCVHLGRPLYVVHRINQMEEISDCDLMVFGEGIKKIPTKKIETLTMVCPARLGEIQMMNWLKVSRQLQIIVPNTGRSFAAEDWNDLAGRAEFKMKLKVICLPAGSERLDPAWEQFKKILTLKKPPN